MEHEAQEPNEHVVESASGSGTAETPPAPGPPPAHAGPPNQAADSEARTWATLAHLASFAGFVVPPVGHFLGPLVVWLIKRDQYPFVDDQGKEALNFQLSMSLYYLVAGLLILVIIGILLLPALVVFSVVVTIVAAVKANAGEPYRYPLNIRFIK